MESFGASEQLHLSIALVLDLEGPRSDLEQVFLAKQRVETGILQAVQLGIASSSLPVAGWHVTDFQPAQGSTDEKEVRLLRRTVGRVTRGASTRGRGSE